ncbi:MAG: recombinase family protein, partial [Rhodoplanes sp.]
MAPLGYETKDRRIVVVEEEAERIRTIFRSYFALGSLNRVLADLRQRGIVTKVRTLKIGRTVGGIPFTRGPLAYLLRNRFYIGEVVFKGEVFPGEQPAILDRDLFDAVQAKLSEQLNNHTAARAKSESPLIGRIYDDRGNRMSPSHVRKQGIRYRYYVSSPLLQGQARDAGSVCRVPAADVEALIGQAVREDVKDSSSPDGDLIRTHVARVNVQADHLAIELRRPKQGQPPSREHGTVPSRDGGELEADRIVHRVPWKKPPSRRRREIIVPQSTAPQDARPIRAETRAALVASIARGRRWLDEIAAGERARGTLTVEQIAAREGCSIRQVNMTISLAFLAPRLV